MSDGFSGSVLRILGSAFAAVGLYLIWYSRRRKRMLAVFAAEHGFSRNRMGAAQLERLLSECLSFNVAGIVREFGQLSNSVDAGSIAIFQAVQLIDLSPDTQPNSTHFSRLAALFDIAPEYDEYFLLRSSQEILNLHPIHGSPDMKIAQVVT